MQCRTSVTRTILAGNQPLDASKLIVKWNVDIYPGQHQCSLDSRNLFQSRHLTEGRKYLSGFNSRLCQRREQYNGLEVIVADMYDLSKEKIRIYCMCCLSIFHQFQYLLRYYNKLTNNENKLSFIWKYLFFNLIAFLSMPNIFALHFIFKKSANI